jgi:hypothetical protein
LDLVAIREPSGDKSDFVITVRIHHDNYSASGIDADADKSLFTLRTLIFHRKTQWIEEHRLSVREADPVLLKIRPALAGSQRTSIQEVYAYIMHISREKDYWLAAA